MCRIYGAITKPKNKTVYTLLEKLVIGFKTRIRKCIKSYILIHLKTETWDISRIIYLGRLNSRLTEEFNEKLSQSQLKKAGE